MRDRCKNKKCLKVNFSIHRITGEFKTFKINDIHRGYKKSITMLLEVHMYLIRERNKECTYAN